MKFYFYILSMWVFLLAFSACDRENNTTPYYQDQFVKLYGSNGEQWAQQLVAVSDGFVMIGETTTDLNEIDIFLVKTDFDGNELWNVTFGSVFNDYVGGLTLTDTEGILVAANSSIDDEDQITNISVYNVSPGGVADSVFAHGDSINSYKAKDITIINSGTGGYLITGHVFDEALNKSSLLNLRLDNSFQPLSNEDWISQYSWGGAGSRAEGIKLIEYNGEFYCLFNTNTTFSGQIRDFDPYIVNISDGGLVENPYNLGVEGVDETALSFSRSDGQLFSLYSSADGGLFIRKSSLGGALGQIKPVPTNILNVQSVDIIEDIYGNYLITGNQVISDNDSNIYLASLSSIGGYNSIIWEKLYGGLLTNDTAARGAIVLNDGSIVFLATIELGHQAKMALFKTNGEGELNP